MIVRQPGPVPGTDEVVEQLWAIAEDLGDMALERLRLAVGASRSGRVGSKAGTRDAVESVDDVATGTAPGEAPDTLAAEERRLTRARRAVERAATLLGGGEHDESAG